MHLLRFPVTFTMSNLPAALSDISKLFKFQHKFLDLLKSWNCFNCTAIVNFSRSWFQWVWIICCSHLSNISLLVIIISSQTTIWLWYGWGVYFVNYLKFPACWSQETTETEAPDNGYIFLYAWYSRVIFFFFALEAQLPARDELWSFLRFY